MLNRIMKPNDILTLDINAIGEDGDGVAILGRKLVYINNVLPGERVRAIVSDVAKTYAHATLVKVIKPSEKRVKARCKHVRECGGCQIQEMDYLAQLALKRQKVIENLKLYGFDSNEKIKETIGCSKVYGFRNKAVYPVAKNADGEIVAGFFTRRSHNIISSGECPIGANENIDIVNGVLKYLKAYNIEPYNEETHSGIVRYIMIRKAFATNSLMVSIIINGVSLPNSKVLIDSLLSIANNIKDISLTVNCDNTNRIRGTEIVSLYGNGFIIDKIGGISFRISPLSFYQVNPLQTEVLYSNVLQLAALTGKETVFDLYCGVGTISLFLAQHSKKVYGVESVSQAVDDARINAEINHINNVEFITGKAEEVIPVLVENQGITADVVVVDPPRKGCDKALIDTIIQMNPLRIVYVSCDSKSLARDLRIFVDNGFKINLIQPVDMFPHTIHIENVALITK